jgi:hypothetical protein
LSFVLLRFVLERHSNLDQRFNQSNSDHIRVVEVAWRGDRTPVSLLFSDCITLRLSRT